MSYICSICGFIFDDEDAEIIPKCPNCDIDLE
jgi:predicted  nucleic acid-binding Zn-ribbon protein